MEICIPLLNIYFNNRVAAFRQRLKILKIERIIERVYERLKIRFRNRRRRERRVRITLDLLKD